MRIISGVKRGCRLLSPRGSVTRPTADRVKESIFNIIQGYFPCTKVLDLFAGVGNLGLEAISRGAKEAVFVEINRSSFAVLKKNIDILSIDTCKAFNIDARLYLKRCRHIFDVIFLDPPYNLGLLSGIMDVIYEKNIISKNGVIVVESEFGGEVVNRVPFKKAKYADTIVSFYTW